MVTEIRSIGPNIESQLRSIHGHHRSRINIINETQEHFKVYWLDYEGRRKECHSDLPPFGRFGGGYTYSTHPFVLTDEGGSAKFIFIAELGDCVGFVKS